MLNKNEKDFLLCLIEFFHTDKVKLENLMGKGIDWVELMGYITYNRLSGLAFNVFAKNEIYLPSQVNYELSFMKNIQELRTNALKKEIKYIAEKLESNNIEFVFLKGSVLANTVYSAGSRSSNDIDILISPDDVTRVGKVLKEIGYVQGNYNYSTDEIERFSREDIIFRRLNWGEVGTYVKKTDLPGLKFAEVDVNISIDWLPTGKEAVIKEMISDRVLYDIGDDVKIPSLKYEDFLIYLCVHLYKEAVLLEMVNKLRDYDLYKYVDIYAFMHVFEESIDWDYLTDRIKYFSLDKECYYALCFVGKIFKSLEENDKFSSLLKRVCPDDTTYLDEVYNGSEIYKWEIPFEERFLNSKRLNHLILMNPN